MAQIENFNLFGEVADLPDVVHCETIQTRSSLHDWELTPHRHGRLHQVLVMDRGAGRVTLDDRASPLADGSLVNVPTGCVHAYSFRPQSTGWVVTVPSEVLDQWLAEIEGLRPLLARPQALATTKEITALIKDIFTEYQSRRFARAHTLRARVALLAGLVAREIAQHHQSTPNPETNLQRRFEALVEAHYTQHLPVADYAARLAVSPTHLSRVMRAATGRPASAVIEDRLIREARRNLAYSNLTISQIAYALGYQDPAYFSRVFSRATGLSPRAFKKQIDARH